MSSRARTAAKRQAAGVDFDASEFLAGLEAAAKRLVVKSEAQLRRTGLRAQSNMKRLCPVDTGRLRSSIEMVDGRDAHGYFVEIGTNVEYAPYVEFGTQHSPAQPFIRPGLLIALRGGKS